MIGIYKITAPDGKVYIGQTKNFGKRFLQYSRLAYIKNHPRLYISVLEHTLEQHKPEIIEHCDACMLNERERYYQDLYDVIGDNGLNCRLTTTKDKPGKIRFASTILTRNAVLAREDNTIGQKAMIKKLIGTRISQKAKDKRAKNMHSSEEIYGKCIFNIETGIFYNSIKEASEAIDMNYTRLKKMLDGSSLNTTPYCYAFESDKSNIKATNKFSRSFENIQKLKEAQRRRFARGDTVHNAKLVFNTVTGIFYTTSREAASSIGVTPSYLCMVLSGKMRNNTNFISA